MLNLSSIKEMKREWNTWNKNIPSRLNPSNINEFRSLLRGYEQRLDQGLGLFKQDMGDKIFDLKHNKKDQELVKWFEYWEKEVRVQWWKFIMSITHIRSSLYDFNPEKAKNKEEEIKRLTDLYSDTDWERYFLMKPLPSQDQLNERAMETLLKRLKTDKGRAERAWRSFAKTLKEFLFWLEGRQLDRENIRVQTSIKKEVQDIKGIPFLFFGEPDEYGERFRQTLVQAAVPHYVQRVKKVAPFLLDIQIPFHVHFQKTDDCGPSAGGCYNARHIDITKDIVLFSNKNPKEIVQVLAHEMGHHAYQTYLTQEGRGFWYKAIKGDYGAVDMEEVIKEWERAGERERNVKKTNPKLYLQFEGLYYNRAYGQDIHGIESAIEAYREGRIPRHIKVLTHPITAYANKNEEEAFCEALGLLIAYGPATLEEKTLSILQVVLPRRIKIAKGAQRVALRYAKLLRG